MFPLHQGIPGTLPRSARDWRSPPVPESRGDPRAPTLSHLGIAVSPQRKGGIPLCLPCPIWEWGAWGPPACPLWDLRSSRDWGYMGSPTPILLWNYGPHDPHVGAPVRGVGVTHPVPSGNWGLSPVTPEWGWFPSPHKATHGGPAPPLPPPPAVCGSHI